MSKAKAKQANGSWFVRRTPFGDKILARPYHFIFLSCILLYAQVLTFGLVHFDDHGFVLMAADHLKLSQIPQFFRHSVFWVLGDTSQDTDVFYRPLQNVVYALCNTIATKQAWIYHLAGLLLHAVTCCVLFRFLRELKYQASVAFVFTLIYSFHPVLVQGVAWIAGIGDQMAALSALLSAIYFTRAVEEEKRSGVNDLLIHLSFFILALFSKEVSIALIPVLLFWYYFIRKSRAGHKKLLMAFISWCAIAFVYFFMRGNAIHSARINLLSSAIESFRVNGPLALEYFEKMFLPYRLSPIPSREDAHLLVGGIVLLVLVSLFVYRKRFTRMTWFGAIWFAVFLFPSFIQQDPKAHFFAFEHRLYLPLIGILIMMMELVNISQVNFRAGSQKYGFAFVLILFFAVTFSHSRTFADPYTFYDKAISSSPGSVIAYNGYGKLLLEDKKYAEAIEAFRKSYEYRSDDLQTTGKIAEIYMKNLNKPAEAITWFKKTLDIAPNSIEAAVSIGDAYYIYLHDTANAITWYGNALKIEPGNEFASASLGMIYAGKGNYGEARNYLTQSLKKDPKNLSALKWMAISYFNEGKIPEALGYLSKAYEFYPDDKDLQRNLMICYYKLNDRTQTEKFASLLSISKIEIPAEIQNYLDRK